MNLSKLNYQVVVFPIFLFFIVFVLWISLMEIGEFVRGMGKVVPSGQIKRVQHLEGGIISDILVKEGDAIKKGQIIYKIRNEFAISNLGELQVNLYAKNATEARLRAELSGAESIQFPAEVAQRYPNIIENENKLFQQRKSNLINTVEVLTQQTEQKRFLLKEYRAKEKNLTLQYQYAEQQSQILERLVKRGAGSEKELIETKLKLQNVLTELEDIQNKMNTVGKEIAEAQARVEESKSKYLVEVQTELSVTLLDIEKLKEQISANLDRVMRTEVVSPVDGLVKSLALSTVGGVVKSGDTIAEIIPTNDTLMVEARIRPEDRGRVWPGLKANIKVTAYDSAIHGGIIGTILDVSADTFLDEGTRAPYYLLKIEAAMGSLGGNRPLYPGMVAEVNIVVGERTILTYFLKPILKVLDSSLIEP